MRIIAAHKQAKKTTEPPPSSAGSISCEQLLQAVLAQLNEAQWMGLLDRFGHESPMGVALQAQLQVVQQQQATADVQTVRDLLRREEEQNQFYRHEFFAELIRFVDRAQKTDAQVYNAIGMNRALWYRLRNDKDARTSKRNVIKIGVVLQLDYWEFYYLVNLAGYSFLPAEDPTDHVLALCIRYEIYNQERIDQLLVESGEKPLFSEE